MVRVMIQLPPMLKDKLDGLRAQGYTAAGFVRATLERELGHAPTGMGAVCASSGQRCRAGCGNDGER